MVQSSKANRFTVGQWTVTPALDRLERNGNSVTIEPKAMAVLVYLARRAGQVISGKDLTAAVWNERAVGDDAVYQRIHRLRTVLEDDPHHVHYIETIPRKGYRLVAPVEFLHGEEQKDSMPVWRRRPGFATALTIAVLLVGATFMAWQQQDKQESSSAKIVPRSIAVLPFVDMSEDQSQKFLGDGISEELIHALSNVPGLKVAARTSAFRFAGKDVDIQAIGEKLNVDTVLEGSVRKLGGRVYITAQLVSVSDGFHLWSKSFDRDATDLIAIQRDIALAVAQVFQVLPLGDRFVEGLEAATADIDAFEFYLLGRYYQRYRTSDALEQSIAYFKKAIEIDPDFARAYAGLAMAYSLLTSYSGQDFNTLTQAAARQALAIDDQEAEVWAAMGLARLSHEDLESAEAAFLRAIELNPNYAMAYQWYAITLQKMERHEESLTMMKMAAELDPQSPLIQMNMAKGVGDDATAEEYFRRAIDIDPDFQLAYYVFAIRLMNSGKPDRAVLLLREYIDRQGPDAYWIPVNVLVWCYRALNDHEMVDRWVGRLAASNPPAWVLVYERTVSSIVQRDYDQAGRLLHTLAGDVLDDPGRLTYIALYEMVIGHDAHALRLYEQIHTLATEADADVSATECCEPAIIEAMNASDILASARVPAVSAAHLYLKENKLVRARGLLEQLSAIVRKEMEWERVFGGTYYILASIHAIEGDPGQSLTALRQAVDAGWIHAWYMELDPNLVSLHDTPEFRQIIADMTGRIDEMRERLRLAETEN